MVVQHLQILICNKAVYTLHMSNNQSRFNFHNELGQIPWMITCSNLFFISVDLEIGMNFLYDKHCQKKLM